jgi:hypothetical protein
MNTLKLLLAVIFYSISINTNAGWICFAHNAKGEVWQGSAETRHHALSHAMDTCTRKSEISRDCEVTKCAVK